MAEDDSIPRSEYPRPQMARSQWLCLNGNWSFGQDPGQSGLARGLHASGKLPGRIVVPFPPESALSGIGNSDFMPCVWYSRQFTIPVAWKGRRLLLHLDAADYEATVWVNGRQVGFHRGGYTPMTFEVTSAVVPGRNLLVVRVVDDTRSVLQPSGKQSTDFASSGCHYTRVTGIWQTVWIEPVGSSFISRLGLGGDPAAGSVRVQAVIDRPAAGQAVEATIKGKGEAVGRGVATVESSLAQACVRLDSVRRWDITDPFLYDVEVNLVGPDGKSLDRVESYVGLRSIRLDGAAILLNERPVFQRLVLDQGYYPDGVYTAPSDAALRRDIELSMQLGFNGARLHQKVFEPRFLYWADKLGYLCWGEFPNWGLDRSNPEAIRRMSSEWSEAVMRDINHPAIVGWCPFNESRGWADPQRLIDIYRLTKMLDPARPVIDASGWDHYETDIYDSHSYEQDGAKFAALFEPMRTGGPVYANCDRTTPYAGQPYFVSEYGGTWWNPSGDRNAWGYGDRPRSKKAFLDRYRKLTTTLLKHPRMCAFCYTQLYDVEQEVNGLMTYGRKMKFDPRQIAAINSQPAAVEHRLR